MANDPLPADIRRIKRGIGQGTDEDLTDISDSNKQLSHYCHRGWCTNPLHSGCKAMDINLTCNPCVALLARKPRFKCLHKPQCMWVPPATVKDIQDLYEELHNHILVSKIVPVQPYPVEGRNSKRKKPSRCELMEHLQHEHGHAAPPIYLDDLVFGCTECGAKLQAPVTVLVRTSHSNS